MGYASWSMERRAISGRVSRLRMRAMTAERLAGVKTSAMGGEVGRLNVEQETPNVEGKIGLTAEAQRSRRDAKEEGFSEDGFSEFRRAGFS